MKELFYEFIKEASTGKVNICDDEWPVSFNTTIEEDGKEKIRYYQEQNLSMLYIKDQEKFFKTLEEYMELEVKANREIPSFYKDKEKNKTKWILMQLFAYATTEDFINPVLYLKKRIDFLNDKTFDELSSKVTISLGERMLDTELEIEKIKNNIAREVPNRIKMTIKNKNGDSYALPSIYYGVRIESNKPVCYIYCIQKEKEKMEETRFMKKINRFLFKINDGVQSTEEDDITDVSMSFVFALNIFISLLQRKKIEKIKVVSYTPVSYLARELTAEKSNRREELKKRNQMIQENQTEKLIRTFRRLCAQNSALQVETYPFYDVDEFLTLSLSPRDKELDNMLLEDTNRQIMEEKKM